MKKLLLINLLHFFFLLWGWTGGEATAQKIRLDSLKTILIEKNSGDEKELQLLNAIAPVQVNINPNDALINADKAIALAQKINNQKELAVAYNNKGLILLRKSKYAEANDFLNKSLNLNTTLNNHNGIADNQINIAEVLRRQGEVDRAKVILENTLILYQQQKNINGIADSYYFLSLVYRDLSDNKNTLIYVDKAIELYNLSGNESGLALALNAKGGYYYRTSDYEKALELGKEAIKINERIGNLYGLALDYGNISNVYAEFPDFPKSIDYSLKAIRIYEQMGNAHMLANTYINIGIFYYELNQFKKALDFSLKGTTLFEQLKINNGQYRNGLNYCGILYWHMNDTTNTFKCLNKSLALNLTAKDDWGLSTCYINLSLVYHQLKNYEASMVNSKAAFAVDERMGNPGGLAIDYLTMGILILKSSNKLLTKFNINLAQKNKMAVDYFFKSIAISNEIENKKVLRDAYEELSKFYETQGDPKKSFEYYKKYISYKDSIMNTENANTVSMLQLQYDTEKKEQQIALLNTDKKIQEKEISKKKTERNGFIAGCILLLMTGGVAYNRYQVKQKTNKELSEALTQLKQAQQQLIEQEKLASLGQLTAGIAHEIQNPLNFIINFSQLSNDLFDDLNKEDDIKIRNEIIADLDDNINKIEKHGLRAEGIIQNMLMHSKTSDFKKQLTNLNSLCNEALTFSWQAMRMSYPDFKCAHLLKLDETIPHINIMHQDISSVLINLINNAFYAVHEKKQSSETASGYEPQLIVQTFFIDGKVHLKVSDNGNGIPADIRNKIFQPFFTTKPTHLGSGLGLSISYDIVKAHGGNLAVESTSPDGTVFVLSLPV